MAAQQNSKPDHYNFAVKRSCQCWGEVQGHKQAVSLPPLLLFNTLISFNRLSLHAYVARWYIVQQSRASHMITPSYINSLLF